MTVISLQIQTLLTNLTMLFLKINRFRSQFHSREDIQNSKEVIAFKVEVAAEVLLASLDMLQLKKRNNCTRTSLRVL